MRNNLQKIETMISLTVTIHDNRGTALLRGILIMWSCEVFSSRIQCNKMNDVMKQLLFHENFIFHHNNL